MPEVQDDTANVSFEEPLTNSNALPPLQTNGALTTPSAPGDLRATTGSADESAVGKTFPIIHQEPAELYRDAPLSDQIPEGHNAELPEAGEGSGRQSRSDTGEKGRPQDASVDRLESAGHVTPRQEWVEPVKVSEADVRSYLSLHYIEVRSLICWILDLPASWVRQKSIERIMICSWIQYWADLSPQTAHSLPGWNQMTGIVSRPQWLPASQIMGSLICHLKSYPTATGNHKGPSPNISQGGGLCTH